MMTATHNVDYAKINYTMYSDRVELHDDYFGLDDETLDMIERNARCDELAAFIALEFDCDPDDVDIRDGCTIEFC